MPTIQTHEICAEGITAHLVHVMAKAFGIAIGTVRAWRQPKASDANPTGTGKGNPLDQSARYIEIVHHYNPGNARKAAQYFEDLVDELDRATGESEDPANILEELRGLVKEESDVVQQLLGKQLDEAALRDACTEIDEARAQLERLYGAVKGQLQRAVSPDASGQ